MKKKTDLWMPLYVGDYLSDTSHLTTEQHGAYVLILLSLWKRGVVGLPDNDESLAAAARLSADRWLSMRSILLDGVLLRTDGTTVTQKRLSAERSKANAISEKRQTSGKEGAAARWKDHERSKPMANANGNGHYGAESLANAIDLPVANGRQNDAPSQSHISTPNGVEKRAKRAPPPLRPDDVADQVWNDWLVVRDRHKADVTQTVIAAARREAAKATMSFEAFLAVWCLRGSRGLQAEWLKPDERSNGETAYERRQRERVTEMTGGILTEPPPGAKPALSIVEEVTRGPFAIGR